MSDRPTGARAPSPRKIRLVARASSPWKITARMAVLRRWKTPA